MKKTILICGGFQLPDRNASAVRALGNARLLQHLGYKVYVLGKLPNPELSSLKWQSGGLEPIECINIAKPTLDYRGPSYVASEAPIRAFVESIGRESVKAIMTYNYPARGTHKVNQLCRELGAASILDCTEWYGWEGKKIFRNLSRLVGVQIKMRFLTKQAGNVIVASYFLERFLPRQHVLKLPFVVDPADQRWQLEAIPQNKYTTFTYSGSPGLGMHKDRLPSMLKAFGELYTKGHTFKLNIVGLTQQQYLAEVPNQQNLIEHLSTAVEFHGRVPHTESIALLKASDFAVFFRKPNRVANVGFSTKFVEAASLGIPVISNATSDIPAYLDDGVNGFLAPEFTDQAIYQALEKAMILTPNERNEMHERCRKLQPFSYEKWRDVTQQFMDNLVVRA